LQNELKNVVISEVGPRDGLQVVPCFIDTEDKIEWIDSLSLTGIRRIEATSFVRPDAVPQMKDASIVMSRIKRQSGVKYGALVPNLFGAERALDSGVDELNVVISASESHNMKNIRRTVAQSLDEFLKIGERCRAHGEVWLKATIATAFGCPYEGRIDSSRINEIALQLVAAGAREITLADTTGMGNPLLVKKIIDNLLGSSFCADLGVHFHNNRGNGIYNTMVAISSGVKHVETSAGGLGGCPFVPEASGNVSTEDLVKLLDNNGIETGIDLAAVRNCTAMIDKVIDKQSEKSKCKGGITK
jgi:hydroxymethylglutaryl-CoA lyase